MDLNSDFYQKVFNQYTKLFSGEEVSIYKLVSISEDKYSESALYEGPFIVYGTIGDAEDQDMPTINGNRNNRYQCLVIPIAVLKDEFLDRFELFSLVTTRDVIVFRENTYTISLVEYTSGIMGGEPTTMVLHLIEKNDLDIEVI